MKVLIVLSTALLAAAAASESSQHHDFHRELEGVAIKCGEKLGKTEADLKKLLDEQHDQKHLVETSDVPKNMLACILRSYKVFDSDDKFVGEALATLLYELFGDRMPKDKRSKLVETLMAKCGGKGNSSEPAAERAKNMFNCLADNNEDAMEDAMVDE
ncbi:hypothetical protein ONE63_007105 [Megalurothrips usitatus]|uniref:Uncharacterized protein n=1 Tax=Megalurothrips usitatus TaxID=439358 RepID=A0AAV7XYH4_9NEOP|nr:hypothetical protein ONE63_007105 [Megalurothrips usitatus]